MRTIIPAKKEHFMKSSFLLRSFDHQESRSIVAEWLEASSNHLISERYCLEVLENLNNALYVP